MGLGEEVFLEGVVAGVDFHGVLLGFEVGLQTLWHRDCGVNGVLHRGFVFYGVSCAHHNAGFIRCYVAKQCTIGHGRVGVEQIAVVGVGVLYGLCRFVVAYAAWL